MLFIEIISFYSENYQPVNAVYRNNLILFWELRETLNTFCGQSAGFINVNAGDSIC